MLVDFYIDIRKHYDFIKVIGHGSFGTVRRAIRKNHSNRKEEVAIKSIPVAKINSLSELKIELEVLRTADHPNIVRLFETYEDSNYVHIVMELCTGGDLMTRFYQQTHINEKTTAKYMQKLCMAVSYLHSIHICHRDLKPENFLFTNKSEDAEIKIIDFGLSTKFRDSEIIQHIVGTPFFIAPEVLAGKYGVECDI